MASSRPGTFIVFEGPDGAGKTQQMAALGHHLRESGDSVIETREPGGTALGNAVRAVLLDRADLDIDGTAELFLLAAARIQHVRQVIVPALSRGAIVLCDRFVDSTFAYQGGGRGLPEEMLESVQAIATDGLVPDIRILLDVPVAVGLGRRFDNPDDVNRLDRLDRAFHERVRAAYLSRVERSPADWIVIDAVPSFDDVAANVRSKAIARLAELRYREPTHP